MLKEAEDILASTHLCLLAQQATHYSIRVISGHANWQFEMSTVHLTIVLLSRASRKAQHRQFFQ